MDVTVAEISFFALLWAVSVRERPQVCQYFEGHLTCKNRSFDHPSEQGLSYHPVMEVQS